MFLFLQIISTWRSGSTFLGDLLMTPQATFYHYEPLIPYGVRRFRSMNSSDTNEALRQLHHLLSCNYTDMGKYAVNHWGKHKK